MYIEKNNSRVPNPIEKVNINEKTSLFCDSYWGIKWFFEEERNVYKEIWTSTRYNINQASLKDIGWYYCYGSYKEKNKHFIAKLYLKVYGIMT